jgi:hypothetical protein
MYGSQSRTFRLLSDSAVRAVQHALAHAVSSWASEWGGAPTLGEVSVQRAWASAPARPLAWNQSVQSGSLLAWLAFSTDLCAELQKILFAADPGHVPASGPAPSLAPAGARQAMEALLDALTRAALPGQQNPARMAAAAIPSDNWERGSGALIAQIAIGRQQCRMLLGSAAVQALQAPAPALPALPDFDLKASVSGVPVSLQIEAGSARVGLGALLSLAPGDVIRLDRQADAPLALSTLSGHGLFDAYLGRSGDHVAVEIVQSHTLLGELQ